MSDLRSALSVPRKLLVESLREDATEAVREIDAGGSRRPAPTASSPSEREPSFRQRFEAALREIEAESDVARSGTAQSTALVAATATTPRRSHASPWAEAVFLGKVRSELAAQSRDSMVRAVAEHVGSTAGRVGELLKAFDAFPDLAILVIGSDGQRRVTFDDQLKDGADRLSRLSFRTLRRLSRIPNLFLRAREVRRLTEPFSLDEPTGGS
jgi:hypothetical protein